MFNSSGSRPISVLIADDHQLIRDMMSAFLSNLDDFEVSMAPSYHEALTEMEAHSGFDIVLLDIFMPGMEGIVSIESLAKTYQGSAIVVFSGTVTNEFVKEALLAGAKGYIPKSIPFKSLVSAITLIASGEVFVPSAFLNPNSESTKSRHYKLSDSELAVLRKVRTGWSNKEIAREMDLTEVTVKMHMRAICSKLGAKNRTQAAVIALREQIS
ncbi:MAG: response regulator [Yoonia sp.]